MTTKKEELADPHGKGFMGDKEEKAKYKADSMAKGVEAWKEGAESTDPCSGGFTGMLPTGFYDLSGNVDWCQAPMPGWQPSWVDIDYMEKLGVGWFLKKWDLYPKCDRDPESFPPKERWKSWDGTLSKYGRALQCYEEYQKRGWDTKAKSKPWLTAPGAKSPAGLGSGVPRGPASGLGGGIPHVLGGDGAAGPMGARGEAGGPGAGGAGSAANPCCCCCPKPEAVTYSGARTNDPQESRQFVPRPGGPVGQTLSGQSQGSYATASFMQSAIQAATQALARAAQAAVQASEGSAAESTSCACPCQEGSCTCCECGGVPEELPSDSAHPGTTTVPEDHPGTKAIESDGTSKPLMATRGGPGTQATSNKPCPPGKLPCLRLDALLGDSDDREIDGRDWRDSIPIGDPRGAGDAPGVPPECEAGAPPLDQIDDEVMKLRTPGLGETRSDADRAAAQAKRATAAKQLAEWARDFPGSAKAIADKVRALKAENPEALRAKQWVKDMDRMSSGELSQGVELGQPGPVLGDLALVLSMDPAAVGAERRQDAMTRFDRVLKKASLEDLHSAALRIQERLHQLQTPDPNGPGKDPRKVCLRGEATSFDAEALKARMKQLIKAALEKLFEDLLSGRPNPPEFKKMYLLSTDDLRLPGAGQKIGRFIDFVDVANGRFEDTLQESHVEELVEEYGFSALQVGDEGRLDEKAAKEWLDRLKRMVKDYSNK